MPGPFRQTDAVLTIAQDNDRRAIEVSAANETASELIGIAPEELQGMAFSEIVTDKVAEDIDDYVEYISGANDVGEVLRKMRNFQIKGKDGKAVSMRLKILRHHAQVHDEFLLIMHDEERERESNAALAALREAFNKASKNADTELPDRATLQKGLELVEEHRESIKNGVCIAVMELDNYDTILSKYGLQACHKAMAAIAQHCQQNLRGNDYIAQADGNRLGFILIGTKREPAKMVLNRLRWLVGALKVRTEQGLDVNSTVSVAFNECADDAKSKELLERLEKALDDKPKDSVNVVVEA